MTKQRMIRPNGFTLMEMLVSLGILGLAAGLMLSGLDTLLVVTARGSQRDSNDQSVASAQMILRRTIEQLHGVTRGDAAEAIIEADGNDQIFNFFAPPPSSNAPDALQRYRLTLSASGDLLLYTASSLSNQVDLHDRTFVGWVPRKLLSGVQSIELRYFGRDRLNGGVHWQKLWVGQSTPPELIAIHLSFREGDRRYWPNLVIRPRITVNIQCKINTTTGFCEGQR